MLLKSLARICAVLFLSGVSSFAVSNTLYWEEALQLVDQNGIAIIPEGYTSIGSEAFRGSNVKVVNLPSSIMNIESDAFKYTSQLEHITIPDSVTAIGNRAFQYSALKTIDLPESPLSIGEYAFDNSELEHIRLPAGSSIQQRAFQNTQLKSLWVGENVNFGNNAAIFHNSHSKLKTIVSYTDFDGYQGLIESYWTVPGQCCNTTEIKGIFGLGFSSTPGNLAYFILRNADINNSAKLGSNSYQSQDFSSSNSATVVIEGEVNFGHDTAFNSAILVKPYDSFIRNKLPETSAMTFCEQIDTDGDSYYDCYDQFPNDPDRWFDYGETSDADASGVDSSSSGLVHSDSDGLADIFDHYPTINNVEGFGENRDQSEYELDTDYDGINNYQDIDDDDDGLLDIYEPFYGTNPLIPDSDFDGVLDGLDAFPTDNTESLDTDTDGIGNSTDTDDDNDGHFDLLDAFPLDANEWMDSDSDGIGNNADPDDDNDGVSDDDDAFPYTASESVDTDGDGVGDNSDAFPNDSSETVDTDLDGIGNNADGDDDNDGIVDADDSDPLNYAVGALESQSIFVMGNPIAVNGYLTNIVVGYDVSDANAQLTGIGYRVHYDSSIFSLSEIQNTLANSNVVDGFGPYQDVENFDNDNTTDSYITFAWASVGGDWPNVELPAQLTDINLFVNWANYEVGSTTSNINFSFIDNAQGYEPKATNYEITVLPATWDFDGDGVADALTDGLMMLRYAFGIQTLEMTVDAISTTATLTPVQIVDSMHRAAILADIDGDDSTDALTDGLLLLRYLFGLRGESLINGVVSFDATRTTAEEIEEYIELYMPPESIETNQCISFANSDEVICTSTTGTSATGSGTATTTTGTGSEEQNLMVGDWRLAGVPDKREYEEGALQDWNFYGSAYSQVEFDSCVADDIYRFGEYGTFEYLINGSTYMNEELNPLYDWNDYPSSTSCVSPLAPWNENQIYSYGFDESNSLLTVYGYGAYIALAHVANGTDDLENAADAPYTISYDFTKLSDTKVLLEIDAYDDFYRFTLERVVD